jgi:hypothetical protein
MDGMNGDRLFRRPKLTPSCSAERKEGRKKGRYFVIYSNLSGRILRNILSQPPSYCLLTSHNYLTVPLSATELMEMEHDRLVTQETIINSFQQGLASASFGFHICNSLYTIK